MHINYYHRRFTYYGCGIDEKEYSQEARKRQEKIEFYQKLIAEGCSQKTALKAIGISRATFYRWNYKYKRIGLAGLEKTSTRPNHVRVPRWTEQDKHFVLTVRKQYPTWGARKLAVIIQNQYNKRLSVSTVSRILKYLLQRFQVKPVAFYYGRIKKRKRIFDKHAQRWHRKLKPLIPGDLIQIDHTNVHMPGLTIKHFKAIDPITKITFERIFKRATSNSGADFLNYIAHQFPFTIRSIQVDGGSEFMGDFEIGCKNLNIPLYVLPPRSPEYNGICERANRTVKCDFYSIYEGPYSMQAIAKALDKYIEIYNKVRPHQALNYLTPWQFLDNLSSHSQSHMY